MNPLNYQELALDYAQAGLWMRANDVLDLAIEVGAVNAMTYYYKTWINIEVTPLPDTPLPICFPNRLEDILALNRVMLLDKKDAQAPYLLGCLYYDKRQYDEAIRLWELSSELNPAFPTVWRNLALAAYNKQDDKQKALELMEKAFHLDESNSRILMELDQLKKALGIPHAERLSSLQQYPALIQERDDLVLEEITLLNQVGRYEEAMTKLDAHKFHPWEGGEGKVPAQYQISRVEQVKRLLANLDNLETLEKLDKLDKAIALLEACLEYPHHLGEGKLYGAQENDFYYLMALAYEKKGETEKMHECLLKATEGPTEPAAAMYYNDAKPDKIFYAALAYRKLGNENKARSLFYRLLDYGEKHIFDEVRMDYFAVSLPDLLIWDGDLQLKNTIHCKLMMALGHIGLGHTDRGLRYLSEVEDLDVNHPVPSALRTLLPMISNS